MNTESEIEKKWIWTDEYIISSYEVDAKGQAPLTTLIKLMQETAYYHADHLDFGYHQLKAKNLFWVLSRLLIKIDRYPKWNDKIQVQTWPSGTERLFAFRDFLILDESGNPIGAAGTAWLMLDDQKRRPQRPVELVAKNHLIPDQRALEQRPAKVPALTAPVKGMFFPVRYSDLDLYNHVNNTKYIQWILDSFPVEMHQDYAITEFEINFLLEAKMGDETAIHSQKENASPEFFHCVKRKADNRDICMARTIWKKEH
jgi:acyl-ACP thioesterase